ncbi:MAG: serpin family protein [Lachnospiraceae bacterium]|nr:serpin family protein [Lachnospiraceae bacterium]
MRKQRKRLLALLVALVIACTACGSSAMDGVTELTGSSDGTPELREMDDTMRSAYAAFAYNLFAKCAIGEDKSCLISPYSVYSVLSMLANGAGGDTAAQMNALLGLTDNSRNAYLAAWKKQLTGSEGTEFTDSNAIFVRKDLSKSVRKDFLSVCGDYYRAQVFAAEMNEDALNAINEWVSEHTKKRIPKILDRLDGNTAMVLLNAITLDAKWSLPFEEYKTTKDTSFYHEDGTVSKVEMLHGDADSLYLENDYLTGCVKSYDNGEYRYIALLPKQGVSLEDVVSKLSPEMVDGLLKNAEKASVLLSIPKYSCEYEKELNEVLSELGMGNAFTNDADFSGLFDGRIDVHVDEVIHKTQLTLDAEGTTAAAATAVVMKLSMALAGKSIKLDRPFVYMIVDQNNLPMFIGTNR